MGPLSIPVPRLTEIGSAISEICGGTENAYLILSDGGRTDRWTCTAPNSIVIISRMHATVNNIIVQQNTTQILKLVRQSTTPEFKLPHQNSNWCVNLPHQNFEELIQISYAISTMGQIHENELFHRI